MNRRLAKKKRKGDYIQLGFHVDVLFKPEITDDAIDAFADSFILLVESLKMYCGGGWNFTAKTLGLFVYSGQPLGKSKRMQRSATPEERQIVSDWCHARIDIMRKLRVAELIDMHNYPDNYDWDYDYMQDVPELNPPACDAQAENKHAG